MTESTAIVLLDEPIKFRNVAAVEDQLLEMLPESEFTPAQLARITAVAREKHPDRRTQLSAILDAAAREAAAHPPAEESPALKALDRFRAEYDPQILIEAGAPDPWLEQNRPAWSSPEEDRPASVYFGAGRWCSQPAHVPMSLHFGRELTDSSREIAQLSCLLVQRPSEREAHVNVVPISWYTAGEPIAHREINLRLDEAAALARALLLLVDAAREEV